MGALSFVESIEADPVVLIDLDDAPLRLEAWKAPPPRVRRSVASSNMVDGGVDTAVSFELRELTATLTVDAADEDEAAAVLSAIGRALSAPRWLRYQAGTSEAVFFRTRVCAPDEIDEFGLTNPGIKRITLVIPADPFAYGLPESGTATIVNDPTQPNGMRFTISHVKGDVPAPLRIDQISADGLRLPGPRMVLGSSSQVAFHHSAPVFTDALPWTYETVSDGTAVGGSFSRATRPEGTEMAETWAVSEFADVLPGEYRVLARARSSSVHRPTLRAVPQITEGTGADPLVASGSPDSTAALSGPGWTWVDLGVMRLPAARRYLEVGAVGGAARVRLFVEPVSPEGPTTIDLDHMVLIPAPGPDGSSGTVLLGATPAVSMGIDSIELDSEDRQAFVSNGEGDWAFSAVAGEFPAVIPGRECMISFAHLSPGDDRERELTVLYSYLPRYLYLRGD